MSETSEVESNYFEVDPKRVSRTPIWGYYTRNADGSDAKCKTCGAVLKTSLGSTTALRKHMQSKHNIECEKNEASIRTNSTPRKPRKLKPKKENISDYSDDDILIETSNSMEKRINIGSIDTNNLGNHLHSSQSHTILRHWQTQCSVNFSASDFILPLFVVIDDDGQEPIESFPGIYRMGQNILINYLSPLVCNYGLSSILLFPCMKENYGDKKIEDALDSSKNPLIKVIPTIRAYFPQLLIITDVCLCAFTEHGHCCVYDESTGQINNSKSVEWLATIALKYAQVGANVIAPSDMMDGRIGAIRQTLNENSFNHVSILTYGAKFESCFYGPFRSAAGSAPKFGDRKQYQLPPGSRGLALRSVQRDINEGADMIMVKPAMTYLDIVKSLSEQYPNYPIAVYQVSGEYSMLKNAAQFGIFDLKRVVMETLTSFKRAGATIIISYFTPDILRWIKEGVCLT